jgi:hypothetical protein
MTNQFGRIFLRKNWKVIINNDEKKNNHRIREMTAYKKPSTNGPLQTGFWQPKKQNKIAGSHH